MKSIIIASAAILSASGLAGQDSSLTGFEKDINGLPRINHPQLKDSAKTGAVITTVGTDANCDYQNQPIQAAIDDGFTHIRVVAGTYTENLSIKDTDMSIEGGYVDCAAADNNDLIGGNITTIDGSGNSSISAVLINESSMPVTPYSVTLRRLIINQGGGGNLEFGGGVAVLESTSDILIDQIKIFSSEAMNGGGIGVHLGTPSILIKDSVIGFNNAEYGGGVACIAGEDALLYFIDTGVNINPTAAVRLGADFRASIALNSATIGNGGGVALSGGCQFNHYTGFNINDNTLYFEGINFNDAAINGGGVSVTGGSSFNAIGFEVSPGLGNNKAPASIRGNSAGAARSGFGNGGGIYVEGVGSTAGLYNVEMVDNTATNGGAVIAENGGMVLTESINANSACWSPGSCNRFHGNSARDVGGVFYINQNDDLNTEIRVYSSQVYNNESDASGSVLNLNGANAKFKMEGSVVYENSGIVTLYNGTDSTATYQFNTIADNEASVSVFRNFQGNIRLLKSIVHNENDVPVYSSSSPGVESFDCTISHENASFPSQASTQVWDPEFIDRENDDYHIDAFLSQAVDYCASATAPDRPNDIDNQPRGWDDYNQPNIYGPYDIGADETYASDVIFKDDFQQ